MTWILVFLGGMVGAALRCLTDRAVQSKHDTAFPWGTFSANLMGCLILGFLAGATAAGAAPEPVRLLLGVGLCGALTTYSTFSYETLRLAETGARFFACANVIVSVAAGLGALALGLTLAHIIWLRTARPMKTPRIHLIAASAAAAALALGAYLFWPRGLEERPSAQAWMSWDVEYPDLGSAAASSDLVLRGTVTGWEADPRAETDHERGDTTDRIAILAVEQVFHQSDRAPAPSESIEVLNGWWEGDRGFEYTNLPWLTEGQSGYFFLRYDPKGDRYSEVGPESRVMVTADGLVPSGDEDPIWSQSVNREALADQAALERRIAAVVGEVEAGLHQPVRFAVCEPSVPGDEGSEPVCEMTW